MQKRILSIMGVIIILLVGFSGGYYWMKTKQSVNSESVLVKLEKSSLKVSLNIAMRGTLAEISNNSITVAKGAESLEIFITGNTKFISFSTTTGSQSNGTSTLIQKEIKLTDLKKGDDVGVAAQILSSGTLEAVSIAKINK